MKTPLPIVLLLVFAWLGVFVLRLIGPSNVIDYDQQRPAAYVQDAARNGNWIIQRDTSGDITSKPPLYTWCAAAVAVAQGEINRFALYLPTALATLGLVLLVFFWSRSLLPVYACLAAALAYLFSPPVAKQICLARTDGVFSLLVFWIGLETWLFTRGRGNWIRFWAAAGLATLTKGPLGILLGILGLLALPWIRRPGFPRTWPRYAQLAGGVLLFALLTVGWAVLAYRAAGDDFIDKMIGRELVGHITGSDVDSSFGKNILKPPFYLLGRFIPWSLLLIPAIWCVFKRPSADEALRSRERFLTAWVLGGLAVFSLGGHFRGDLLLPLLPPSAMLIAGYLARLNFPERLPAWGRASWKPALLVFGFGLVTVKYLVPWYKEDEWTSTRRLENLAGELRERYGAEFPYCFVDSPYTLQFYLDIYRPGVDFEVAAAHLAKPEPAVVLVPGTEKLAAAMPAGSAPFQVLQAVEIHRKNPLLLIGNAAAAAALSPPDSATGSCGPIAVELHHARVERLTTRSITVQPSQPEATLQLHNQGADPVPFTVQAPGDTSGDIQLDLQPGERLVVQFTTDKEGRVKLTTSPTR